MPQHIKGKRWQCVALCESLVCRHKYKLLVSAGSLSDLCVEDGEGLCCVKWDEDPNQELLVFRLQRQGEAVYDAGTEETRRWLKGTFFTSVT